MVTPSSIPESPAPAALAPAAPSPAAEPQTTPAPAPAVVETTITSETDQVQTAPTTYWQGDPAESISWTASEFIAHHKTPGWYLLAMVGAVMAAVIIWFITKDVVSPLVIIVMGAIVATFAARQPRQLSYQLDPHGLTIGNRSFTFGDFRSFSVVPDGAFSSIVFAPLKRFGVLTTIYYDPQDEEHIVDILSQYLPHEVRQPDPLEQLMRRLRF